MISRFQIADGNLLQVAACYQPRIESTPVHISTLLDIDIAISGEKMIRACKDPAIAASLICCLVTALSSCYRYCMKASDVTQVRIQTVRVLLPACLTLIPRYLLGR